MNKKYYFMLLLLIFIPCFAFAATINTNRSQNMGITNPSINPIVIKEATTTNNIKITNPDIIKPIAPTITPPTLTPNTEINPNAVTPPDQLIAAPQQIQTESSAPATDAITQNPAAGGSGSAKSASTPAIAPINKLKIPFAAVQIKPDYSTGSDIKTPSLDIKVERVEVDDENSKTKDSAASGILKTNIKIKPTIPTLGPTIKIITPNGGENMPLDGQANVLYFTQNNFDISKNGQYEFQAQLWKNGAKLGVFPVIPKFTLNLNQEQANLGYVPGKYIDNGLQVADPGDGYQIRVVVYLGDQEVASDMSDDSFSLEAAGKNNQAPYLKVLEPKGGEQVELDGAQTQNILFTFGGNFDMFKNGHYKIHPELWRNGAKLGDLFNTDFSLNLNNPNGNIGFQPGVYLVKTGQYDLEKHIADPGSGYAIKLIVFDDDIETASAMSDGNFSYIQASSPIYDSSKPSTVSLIEPNGGESYPIVPEADGSVIFSTNNFDPYQGGQYTFQAELWKGGKKLGVLANYSPFPLNIYKEHVVLSYRPNEYETDNPVSSKAIEPGSDYTVKVVIYKDGEIVTEDASQAPFSFVGKAIKPRKAQIVNGPDDIKPYLAELINNNANVQAIDVNDSTIDITYKAPAKLFGFIPVHYDLKISQDVASKNIKVKKPWWLFLTSNNAGNISKAAKESANLFDDFSDEINSISESDMLKLQNLMEKRQQAIQTVSNILKAMASSSQSIVQNIK